LATSQRKRKVYYNRHQRFCQGILRLIKKKKSDCLIRL